MGECETPQTLEWCPCKNSCKTTGCARCCTASDYDEAAFWGTKVEKQVKEHEHEYCHVHPEDKNRTIQKTIWKDVNYTAKQTVFKPVKRMVKKTVLET